MGLPLSVLQGFNHRFDGGDGLAVDGEDLIADLVFQLFPRAYSVSRSVTVTLDSLGSHPAYPI